MSTQPPPSSAADLERLRNLEEFAALGQFLYLFGTDLLGLPDSFSLEDLETELFTAQSEIIVRISMGLLRAVSSHRGLVPEQFEEYARRQYVARKPGMPDPFGDEAEGAARRFVELDVFTRVRILHQLSVWAFQHPERVRDKVKNAGEKEQLLWRMEPAGYDRAGNTYYILDDNRLYRRTPWTAEPPPPPKKSKAKRKAAKRRRVSTAEEDGEEERSIGGLWSCVCVSLHDWTVFVSSFDNSKDVDEKALRAYLKEEVVPDLTKTWLEKEKQRQLQEAVANRKRSGRLDAKIARQKEEEQKAAAAKKEAEAAAAARKERLEAEKKEKERAIRMRIRQERLKTQSHSMITSKANSSRGTSADDSSSSAMRRSSRRAKAEPPKEEKIEDWVFDCVCGAHGINYEDGTNIIACDSCDVWQHLKCVKLPPGGEDADFICDLCLRYKESREGPVEPNGLPPSPQIIKLRVGPPSPEKARGPFDEAVGSAVTANSSPKHSEFTEPIAMDIENSATTIGKPPLGMADVGGGGTSRDLPTGEPDQN
ncbi:hypothetical protein BZA05DRAFT_389313 [Tricharina praecox]|uniref:uncharacterized protein n=1 Tax=Tricharina praecox TaxID=43433 RepID=UPI00221E866A|nr:uncharacterized protein BZA05DRAFT_389313 [Tricharina praecox]KAI5855676.1 hypothetical protein BZA05DRAFT_389313 [Tricharina praecox]